MCICSAASPGLELEGLLRKLMLEVVVIVIMVTIIVVIIMTVLVWLLEHEGL